MTFKVLLHHYGRFTSPPERKFIDGLVATVDPVELDNFSTNQIDLRHGAEPMMHSRRIICRSMASSSNEARKTIVSKLQRELEAEATFANQLLCNLTRYREQMHDPLIEYGRYALGCMTGPDMKKAAYLKSVRDELLRSMEEKRQLIANYREM
ncbi:hypothetical protein Tco_0319392 [Tanacetum coccineum]